MDVLGGQFSKAYVIFLHQIPSGMLLEKKLVHPNF